MLLRFSLSGAARAARQVQVWTLCLGLLACGGKEPEEGPPPPGPDRATKLAQPVEVVRDPNGIAHVYANGTGDLLFAQGYETARDRLLHMDYWRRYAYGTRAEVLGAKYLADDTVKRAIGFRRQAEQNLAHYQAKFPRVHDLLVSYSNGVNAAIADMKAGRNGLTRPSDLDRIEPGYWPEPWSPVDCVALGRALVFSQNFGGDTELVIFALKLLMGPENFAAVFRWQPLFATYILEDQPTTGFDTRAAPLTSAEAGAQPGVVPFAPPAPERLTLPPWLHLPPAARPPVAQALAAMAQALAEAAGRRLPGETGGSNSWAVQGSLTTDGKGAILCNDPHMAIELPPRLYAMHLVDTSRDKLGAFGHGMPGTPLLTFGATAKVAWGITNSFVDATDLYLEQPCDGDAGVQLGAKCVPIEVRDEAIRVRPEGGTVAQAKTEMRKVRWVPHHGPVLNDIVPADVGLALKAQGLLMSARWTGFATDTEEAAALLGLLEADSVTKAQAALQHFNGGVMNWTLADAAGHVAYVAAGAWPKRAKPVKEQPPWDPLPGDGSAEWLGVRPASEVPQVVDPKKGFVVTANNQQGPQANDNDLTNDASYFGHFQDLGTRAHRITQRLAELTKTGKVALPDMAALQVDDRAVLADALLPALLAEAPTLCAATADPGPCSAVQTLAAWDRDQGEDSRGALLFGTWFNHLVRDAVGDEVPSLVLPLVRGFMASIGAKAVGAWLRPGFAGETRWDDVKTKPVENAGTILRGALAHALGQLTSEPGLPPLADLRWGDVHKVSFRHVFFPELTVGPLPRSGGHRTVNAADYPTLEPDGTPARLPWLMTEGSVFRFCVQLGPNPAGFQGLAGGQSSESTAPHFKSQIDAWLAGQTHPIRWTRQAVESGAESKRTLAAGTGAP